MNNPEDSLLSQFSPGAEPTPNIDDPDATCVKVRVCFHSGAFIEGWFKNMTITKEQESQKITKLAYQPPELPEGTQNFYFDPTYLDLSRIESIWTMTELSAAELYRIALKQNAQMRV